MLKVNRRQDTRTGNKPSNHVLAPFIANVHQKNPFLLEDINGNVLLQKYSVCKLNQQVAESKVKENPLFIHVDIMDVPYSFEDEIEQVWIAELNLFRSDATTLLSGGWLNDRLMDAVNTIVSSHLGNAPSQTTLLSQSPSGFRPVTANTVQILHDHNHWVTTAFIIEKVMYADSLRQPVSKYVQAQMKQLYATQLDVKGQLKVTMIPCQRQCNGSDCGVFAAANAFSLAYQLNPADCFQNGFDILESRQHLFRCLESQKLVPFPKGRHCNGVSKEEAVIVKI